ncbi:MAG: class I SAM-dependent methyltransferase [Campylobacterales bacterium]|nr:class I SAM-dependent methyltransferase [Campylobacterales bacterium]
MEESIGKLWDEKFSREEYFYGFEPNAFIALHTPLLRPQGELLCLGEGEGRNAVYLAAEGFKVTALDASAIGMTKALAMAKAKGVSLKTLLLDLEQWEPQEKYEGILTSYLHLEEPLRTKVFQKAINALKPQGYFIGEFFSLKQLPRSSGGPKKPSLLYTLGSLKEIFAIAGCEIVLLEECEVCLDEGKGHQGDALVIRVIVKKS